VSLHERVKRLEQASGPDDGCTCLVWSDEPLDYRPLLAPLAPDAKPVVQLCPRCGRMSRVQIVALQWEKD
jgi:hypothetical protein